MNIAVIAHAHFPIKQPYAGGLEAHTDLLVNQLVAMGHAVTLYAKAGSETKARLVSIFDGDAEGGKSSALHKGYERACRDIDSQSYDLVFNNCLDGYPLAWHKADKPPMLTVFHTPPFWELSNILRMQKPQQNRRFIAVSALTASQWQEFCIAPIDVVPNGIDMSKWPSHTEPPKTESAVWSGRITPEKGTEIAIKAAALADVPLILCGPIYDEEYFEASVKPYIDNGSVTYVGPKSQAEVNRYYADASVALVTPMWDEPFGLVAVEALASGVPVAALNHGATADILRYEYGALAQSDSPEDLADAIKKALTIDRGVCARYAHTTYGAAAMVAHYLQLIPRPAPVEGA